MVSDCNVQDSDAPGDPVAAFAADAERIFYIAAVWRRLASPIRLQHRRADHIRRHLTVIS